MQSKKPIIVGLISGGILLALYFVILSLVNSFSHATEQFVKVWYWVLLLSAGFGTQIGLYSYIKTSLRERMVGATVEVAATGGVSTGSMIACCVHHISDVLPLIGLSAAGVFLAKYQLPFILTGVFSNLAGITMMLGIIQKHSLFDRDKNFLQKIFSYNMKVIRNVIITLSLVVISIVSISLILNAENTSKIKAESKAKTASNKQGIDLSPKTNNENDVIVEVTPKDFSSGSPVKFGIAIDVHEGSLDFDLTKISILEDDKGNEYLPLEWQGSPPGGHHRSGTLSFPSLKKKTNYIKLIVKDVFDVPERVFVWEIE